MGFDPISLGIQGVMGYMGSMGQARASRANAAISRRWAEYSKKRAESDRKSIWGQFKQDKELQAINNAATQGSVQASAGATGVVTSGGILDVMADSIDRGIGAIQQMRSSALRAVANVTNTGNAEVYKYEIEASTYDRSADEAESAAMMSLVGAGIGMAASGGLFTGSPGEPVATPFASPLAATEPTNYSQGIGSRLPKSLQRRNIWGGTADDPQSYGSFSLFGGYKPFSVKPPWAIQ